MSRYYEKAIYQELGEDIEKELKENHSEIIINYDDVTYSFSDCPDSLVKKITKVKKLKGKGSILNEFRPDCSAVHLKWNMSKKNRICFIKSFHDFETTLDLLIFEQRATCEKLRKNSEV